MEKSMSARHEFIGLTVEITKSLNKDLVGLAGKVLDETKNSFVIEKGKKRKHILKNQIIELMIVEKNEKIDARHLMKRPEERIKGEKNE